MIVPGQMVEVKWHPNNKEHFESLGYRFTSLKDKFEVKVDDLLPGQSILVKVKCDYCNKEKLSRYVKVINKNNHYCDTSCMFKYKQEKKILPPTYHLYNCDGCGKEISVENYRYERLLSGEYKGLYCSKTCSNKYTALYHKKKSSISNEKITLTCKFCDKEFQVNYSRRNRAKYCSEECKSKSKVTSQIVKCENCGKETSKTYSVLKRNKNLFCSPTCSNEFKIKINSEVRICEYCQNEFTTTKASKKRFCNTKCQSKWQSEFLIGENANNFNSDFPKSVRHTECGWCKENVVINSPYKYNMVKNENKNIFCSDKCYREWYAKFWSQREEWKEESRIRTVKMIGDGKFPKLNNSLQKKVEALLDKMKIEYIPEFNCKYHAIDLYIPAFNLFIELNGRFWHCDPRVYNEINYKQQLTRIIQDKRKRRYILNKYNSNILYLWETDINSNIELIEKLIRLASKQKLKNYQSFNYFVSKDEIQLNKNIIKPYIEYDINELNSLFHPKDNNQVLSKKQIDKWIVFKCENCGKEAEQLKSRYVKSKHHYCSRECHYRHSLI